MHITPPPFMISVIADVHHAQAISESIRPPYELRTVLCAKIMRHSLQAQAFQHSLHLLTGKQYIHFQGQS